MCLVAFQKNFRKIFSDVWKRRRKRQTQEKYHQRSRSEIVISPARSRDQRRELATARSLDRRITRSHRRDLAIDASRDHAIDRDLHNDRRTGAREIGAAWSLESAGDCRTDWNVSSPLARVRSLSLSLSLFPEML